MAFKHVLSMEVNNDGTVVGSPQTFESEGEANVDVAIPENQDDMPVPWSVDVSQIQSILIEASQDMTFKTNSSTVPDNTLNLLAGVPYVWHVGSYFANLLTVSVTSVFVTNTTAGTLKIQCALDAVP